MGRYDPINGHRSVSQLQNYSKCAHQWYLQRLLRVPERAAAWFIQGTAVHSAVEAYERSYRTLSAVQAQSVFDAAWEVDLADAERRQPDHRMWMVGGKKTREEDLERRWNLGRQQVADYIEHNRPEDEWLPTELIPGEPAVEVPFKLVLDGVEVIGFIDTILEHRRSGALRIRDVKTGTRDETTPYQMATYKIAVQEMTGVVPDSAAWWMCKDTKDKEFEGLARFDRDMVSAWYVQMDAGVKAGSFVANPGDCFTCAVRPYCHVENPHALPLPVFSA